MKGKLHASEHDTFSGRLSGLEVFAGYDFQFFVPGFAEFPDKGILDKFVNRYL